MKKLAKSLEAFDDLARCTTTVISALGIRRQTNSEFTKTKPNYWVLRERNCANGCKENEDVVPSMILKKKFPYGIGLSKLVGCS